MGAHRPQTLECTLGAHGRCFAKDCGCWCHRLAPSILRIHVEVDAYGHLQKHKEVAH